MSIVAILDPMVAKLIGQFASGTGGTTRKAIKWTEGQVKSDQAFGVTFKFGLIPSMSFNVTPKSSESKSYNRKESFTIGMDKKSHLDFDVYHVKTQTDNVASGGVMDVFVGNNSSGTRWTDNKEYLSATWTWKST